MKPTTLLICILLGLSFKINAQNDLQNETILNFEVNISYEDDTILTPNNIKNLGINLFSNDKKERDSLGTDKKESQSSIEDFLIRAEYGSIIIELNLEEIEEGYYKIPINELKLFNSKGEEIAIRQELVYGDIDKNIDSPKKRLEIILSYGGELDMLISFSGKVKFSLFIKRYGKKLYDFWREPIDCSEEIPQFKPKKLIIHSVPVIISGVFYYLGKNKKKEAQGIYDLDYLSQSERIKADPLYKQVINLDRESSTLNRIGHGINIANGIWLVGRYLIHKERKRVYQENCSESVFLINPFFLEIGNGSNSSSQFGFVMHYNF